MADCARTYPYILKAGADSSHTIEAQQKLCTPIAGANFVSKILRSAGETKKQQPKVKAPNLEDDNADYKKAAKAKAKGKAKAKSSSSKRKTGQLPDAQQENAAALQDDVKFEVSFRGGAQEGLRPRRWIDDLLQALVVANRGKELKADWDSAEGKLFGMLVSYGLEFALVGKLSVGKKTFKDWSKA